MELHKKEYNSKIKIYYNKKEPDDLCKGVMDYFWLSDNSRQVNWRLSRVSSRQGIEVFRLDYDNEIYYLKKYSHTRISKKIQSIIRSPEGIRNFKNAVRLLQADILTPEPVFALTKRNVVTFDSILITEKADGIELNKYIKQNNLNDGKKILKLMAEVCARFINNNFAHQDPTLDNFFY